MQNAGTVLDVLRERGRRGLPLDELYRQLFNPQLYLLAYGRIYSNKGAMTPGATGETDPRKRAPRWRPTSTLWHNLAEAVERAAARHRSCLQEPPPQPGPGTGTHQRRRLRREHSPCGRGPGTPRSAPRWPAD